MDYEKAYKEALERARQIKDGKDEWRYSDLAEITPALTEIFPELRESEDERMRKAILAAIRQGLDTEKALAKYNVTYDDVEAWLEKQKENPKTAISIPADCASNAKCEDRWHKVKDFLPEDSREVICKDAIGNYFIGRYYKCSDSWEVMMYDDCDKSNEDNPPVVMWVDIPSEKQKEQKPELVQHPPITYTYNSNASRDERLKAALLALLNSDLLKVKEGGYFTKQDLIDWVERIPTDKPAWSEEDEKMVANLRSTLANISVRGLIKKETEQKYSSWLKSLRPSCQRNGKEQSRKTAHSVH